MAFFEGRAQINWALRTLNMHDRTEPRVRVPGVRAPTLILDIQESRIWREIAKDTEKSMCWRGITVVTFSGFETFEVRQFPYDRQIIDLGLVEFVWRSHQEQLTFDETMKVVHLNIETRCMLAEWETWPALITPQRALQAAEGPLFCSSFDVKLRLQRKERFYLTQIFCVTFLILISGLLPLGMDPLEIGDRLAIHSAGLLTLVAFKYGVQHDLPVVPYSTFTSKFLTSQTVTLVSASIESLISFKLVSKYDADPKRVESVEEVILGLTIFGWFIFLCFAICGKGRDRWDHVLENQDAKNVSCHVHQELRRQRTGLMARVRSITDQRIRRKRGAEKQMPKSASAVVDGQSQNGVRSNLNTKSAL